MQPPDPIAAMVQALMAQKGQGQTQLAGDVVQLPIQPRPSAGPTTQSAPFAWSNPNQTAPNVLPIGNPTMTDWLTRMRLKQSGR